MRKDGGERQLKSERPSCPNCGTSDYSVNQNGTMGYCTTGCWSVFRIENDRAILIEEEKILPITFL